jgi:catechol 2,3-dioxygenase-like lactoylglutathione lyase family enzyme
MKLGAFSISLTVKDISASRKFYEALGFTTEGNEAHKWLIMKNGDTLIGLFEGMFDKNILTFNPGWDQDANEVNPFDDVREIQKRLRSAGIEIETTADEAGSGPAHITFTDPDGNNIMIDQHR